MSPCGTFLRSGQYFLSNALKDEDIGLEEVGHDIDHHQVVAGILFHEFAHKRQSLGRKRRLRLSNLAM